jgi:hypothetical protein
LATISRAWESDEVRRESVAAEVQLSSDFRNRPRRSDPNRSIGVYLPEQPCERYPFAAGRVCVFCHLEVASLSDTALKRCHGHLTRIAKAIDGDYVDDPRLAAPLRLKWAHAALDHPQAEFATPTPTFPKGSTSCGLLSFAVSHRACTASPSVSKQTTVPQLTSLC